MVSLRAAHAHFYFSQFLSSVPSMLLALQQMTGHVRQLLLLNSALHAGHAMASIPSDDAKCQLGQSA